MVTTVTIEWKNGENNTEYRVSDSSSDFVTVASHDRNGNYRSSQVFGRKGKAVMCREKDLLKWVKRELRRDGFTMEDDIKSISIWRSQDMGLVHSTLVQTL